MARGVDRLVEGARLAGGGVGPAGVKAHEAPALGVLDEVHDRAGEHDLGRLGRVDAAGAVVDDDARLAQALAGVDQALPHMPRRVEVLAALEQQGLGHPARAVLAAHQARGHHSGAVCDEKVARLEVVDDVGEHAVLDRAAVGDRARLAGGAGAAVAIEHEQAAGVARLGGSLGDELVGKVVVEVVGAHRGPSTQRGARPPAPHTVVVCHDSLTVRGHAVRPYARACRRLSSRSRLRSSRRS